VIEGKRDLAVRSAPWLLLGIGLAVFWLDVRDLKGQMDDAFISYRYARNLVEGYGLVYNAGEFVEGYTNLLWTLLAALGIGLGREATEVGRVLGIASGTAALIATFVYARACRPDSRALLPVLAVTIVMTSEWFGYWATSGLETALFVTCSTFALAAWARERRGWATFAAGLATLTRPEGVLIAAVLFGLEISGISSSDKGKERRGGEWWALRPALAYVALLALLTAFRLAYYGSPLPNTFYAKVGGIPLRLGVAYLWEFLADGAFWLLLPAAMGVIVQRRFWPGAAFVLLLSAYVVAIGGDAFAHSRFLMPALPCLAVFAVSGADVGYRRHPLLGITLWTAVALAATQQLVGGFALPIVACVLSVGGAWALGQTSGRRALLPVAVALIGVGLAADATRGDASWLRTATDVPRQRCEKARGMDMLLVTRGRRQARQVVDRLSVVRRGETKLVAAAAIGALGYYSRLPILDIFGLVDAEIARSPAEFSEDALKLPGHQRSNAPRVFDRTPDFILVPSPEAWPFPPAPALAAIWAHPDLATHYRWDEELRGYRRKGHRGEQPRSDR
jgi:hypothetical protein